MGNESSTMANPQNSSQTSKTMQSSSVLKRSLEHADQDTPEKRQRRFTTALAKIGDSFSDFTIVKHGLVYPVHRLVISAQSGFFERLCKNGFRESEERRVVLDDDPACAVALMIKYFYSFEYDFSDPSLRSIPDRHYGPATLGWAWFLIHAQLVVLADKYDILGLGTLATKHFNDHIEQVLSKDKDEAVLATAAEDLLKATKYVYENMPREKSQLRHAILRAYRAEHFRLLRHTKRREFRQLLSDVPEFASDYIEKLAVTRIGDKLHAQKSSQSRSTQSQSKQGGSTIPASNPGRLGMRT